MKGSEKSMITNNKYAYPNVIAQMASHGDTILSLSKALGMGYQTLSARLRGKKAFELPEICAVMQRYDCSFDYLFAPDPQPSGQKTA